MNPDTGTSYQDRLLELEGDTASQEQEMIDIPEPAPIPEPIPAPETEIVTPPEPVIDPDPELTPAPEPAPISNEPPAWAEQLLEQQAQILAALQKIPTQKPVFQPAPTVSLKPLEDKMQSLQTTVSGLEKAVNGLEKTNVDVLRDSKNFQADSRMKMQKDLDKYQKLFADDVFAPLLTDMAKIYINCWKCINALEDEKIRNNLEGLLLESMEELFEDNGVEINQTAVGTARSLRTCKTRKTVPTGDEALHGAVALSLNPSFSLGRLVLVKEVVDTFVFDPALKPAEQEEAPVEPEAVPTEPEEIIPAEDNTTAE